MIDIINKRSLLKNLLLCKVLLMHSASSLGQFLPTRLHHFLSLQSFWSYPVFIEGPCLKETKQLGNVQAKKIEHHLCAHILQSSSLESCSPVVLLDDSEDALNLNASINSDLYSLR